MKFKRTIRKLSDFPATKRSNSRSLKEVLLRIGLDADRNPGALEEAYSVIEAFMVQVHSVESKASEDDAQDEPDGVTEDTQDDSPEETVAPTKEELEAMHYRSVDKVAQEYGVSTEGTKAETIELILAATKG